MKSVQRGKAGMRNNEIETANGVSITQKIERRVVCMPNTSAVNDRMSTKILSIYHSLINCWKNTYLMIPLII